MLMKCEKCVEVSCLCPSVRHSDRACFTCHWTPNAPPRGETEILAGWFYELNDADCVKRNVDQSSSCGDLSSAQFRVNVACVNNPIQVTQSPVISFETMTSAYFHERYLLQAMKKVDFYHAKLRNITI